MTLWERKWGEWEAEKVSGWEPRLQSDTFPQSLYRERSTCISPNNSDWRITEPDFDHSIFSSLLVSKTECMWGVSLYLCVLVLSLLLWMLLIDWMTGDECLKAAEGSHHHVLDGFSAVVALHCTSELRVFALPAVPSMEWVYLVRPLDTQKGHAAEGELSVSVASNKPALNLPPKQWSGRKCWQFLLISVFC